MVVVKAETLGRPHLMSDCIYNRICRHSLMSLSPSEVGLDSGITTLTSAALFLGRPLCPVQLLSYTETPAPLLTSHVALGKSQNLSVLQLSIVKWG
jgi:hypothetical protein